MKLHYFYQQEPDGDDAQLASFKALGAVPVGCLLGGRSVLSMSQGGLKPCDSCGGPRPKCGGTPLVPEEERETAHREAHIAHLITGDPPSVLEDLLRGK